MLNSRHKSASKEQRTYCWDYKVCKYEGLTCVILFLQFLAGHCAIFTAKSVIWITRCAIPDELIEIRGYRHKCNQRWLSSSPGLTSRVSIKIGQLWQGTCRRHTTAQKHGPPDVAAAQSEIWDRCRRPIQNGEDACASLIALVSGSRLASGYRVSIWRTVNPLCQSLQ